MLATYAPPLLISGAKPWNDCVVQEAMQTTYNTALQQHRCGIAIPHLAPRIPSCCLANMEGMRSSADAAN